jgi:hypothetical protein
MDIDKIFEFVSNMVPQIGVIPTVILLLFLIAVVILIGIILKVLNSKDKMTEYVLEELSNQSDRSMEFMKTAVSEIKELSILSTTELRGNTKQIETLVNLLHLLIADGTISKKSKDDDDPTPTNNKKKTKKKTKDQDLPDGGDGS